MILKLGHRWPEDKAKIEERLAASSTLVAAREPLGSKALAWRAEQRAKAQALAAKGLDAYDDGKSALYYAVSAADSGLVQVLLDKGADPNGREKDDAWAPIHAAASGGTLEITALLIERGAKIDPRSQGVPPPIQIAVGSDNNAVVSLLLEKGADANSVSAHGGGSLLHQAATQSDNREMIELLLKHGANPNARDSDARTPLHVAASTTETRKIPVPLGKIPGPPYGRKIEIVQALLKGGADPGARDVSGRTPAEYAQEGVQGREVRPDAKPRFEQIVAQLKAAK
jgi:ankyrin repeat protein